MLMMRVGCRKASKAGYEQEDEDEEKEEAAMVKAAAWRLHDDVCCSQTLQAVPSRCSTALCEAVANFSSSLLFPLPSHKIKARQLTQKRTPRGSAPTHLA
jgi:hypothetical protein